MRTLSIAALILASPVASAQTLVERSPFCISEYAIQTFVGAIERDNAGMMQILRQSGLCDLLRRGLAFEIILRRDDILQVRAYPPEGGPVDIWVTIDALGAAI